jgi:hypothetical protein
MGVWERSPRGTIIAREHPGLQRDYRQALADYSEEDCVGSPYCVRRYEVDPALGGRAELAVLRERLHKLGLGLILDFVPNHVAPDHPWATEKPECLLQGASQELQAEPESFAQVGERIFANGRDPHFPPWTDTLQVNAFSETLRNEAIATLLDIAGQCDGVRCDMAMLVTNEIFAGTWGSRAGSVPKTEYWEVVIPAVRAQNPNFLFIAEVYWDLESDLLRQGFDYCYDKRLYDRLTHQDAQSVAWHLVADLRYQERLARFIENHDEQRAFQTLGAARSRMAAVLVATLPGAKLWHEGQFAGHKVKLPVQLRRRPPENTDKSTYQFYQWLLHKADQPVYRQGQWQRREVIPAWPGNETHRNMIAYTWQFGDQRRLVIINYSNVHSQCRIRLTDFGLEGHTWTLEDRLNQKEYERQGDRMISDGLYIDLTPWNAHIFAFTLVPD